MIARIVPCVSLALVSSAVTVHAGTPEEVAEVIETVTNPLYEAPRRQEMQMDSLDTGKTLRATIATFFHDSSHYVLLVDHQDEATVRGVRTGSSLRAWMIRYGEGAPIIDAVVDRDLDGRADFCSNQERTRIFDSDLNRNLGSPGDADWCQSRFDEILSVVLAHRRDNR